MISSLKSDAKLKIEIDVGIPLAKDNTDYDIHDIYL